MNGAAHMNVQDQHRRWQDEHAEWVKDINRWQTEHQVAMFDLERLATLLRTHADTVRTHADTIDSHEHVLSKPGATDSHGELAAKHHQQRELHARIADRHEGVMAQFHRLVEVIRETM